MNAALALTWVLATATASAPGVEEHIARCEARAESEGRWPIRCLVAPSRTGRATAIAIREHLEATAESADDPRLRLELALVWLPVGHERSESMLIRAADELASAGDAEGEVNARLALARFLSSRSFPTRSRTEVERVLALAKAHDEDMWQAMALLESGTAAAHDGYGDASLGRRRVERALELLPPDSSPRLRAAAHGCLAQLAKTLGDLHGARRHAHDAARSRAEAGDDYGHAEALVEELWLETEIYERAYADWPSALTDRVRRGIEDARGAGNGYAEATLSCMLGEMLDDPAERIEHLEHCVRLRGQIGIAVDEARAVLAWNLAHDRPDRESEALAMLDGAIASAASVADPWGEASGLDVRAGLRWERGDEAGAIADWERHFSIIEAIRDRQPDREVQEGVFAHWAPDYLRVSGLVLAAPQRSDDDVARAFDVMERLRARRLLDALDASGATAARRFDGPAAEQRAEVQAEAAQVSERLADESLDETERASLFERLAALDRREHELRERLAREQPTFARLHQPFPVSIDEVQQGLGEDEVVLTYQVSMERGPRRMRWGGSWMLAITRERVRVHALPDERRIVPAVRRFGADLAARAGHEAVAGRQLYRWLLAPALEELPPEIDTLIIIPDHALHALPFAALEGPEGLVAERYEVGRAPSVTTWMDLRAAASTAPRSVLALADPRPLPEGVAASLPTSLPGTRHEASVAVAAIGGTSEMWLGAEASEAGLRALNAERFAVVHLGAHTVIHEARPSESAILLSPGAGEDGALHPDELGRMDLGGTLVVLAACQGAGGRVMAGEGPLGPARAAFLAGARTVVASLWPIRDDEALAFFTLFYEGLGRGDSAGESMAFARRTLMERGAPPHAWAGIVLIGDADLRLEAPPSWPPSLRHLAALGLFVVALLAFGRFAFLRWFTAARLRIGTVD